MPKVIQICTNRINLISHYFLLLLSFFLYLNDDFYYSLILYQWNSSGENWSEKRSKLMMTMLMALTVIGTDVFMPLPNRTMNRQHHCMPNTWDLNVQVHFSIDYCCSHWHQLNHWMLKSTRLNCILTNHYLSDPLVIFWAVRFPLVCSYGIWHDDS